MKPYYRYVEDVASGKVTVGENIKLAISRFQKDLERQDLELKEDVVDNAIDFISTLKHFTGKSSGNNFILEDWQAFIVANIVGWYWKGTKSRRYTSSYIEISRKQGKALALTTKIPTPEGWTTMGELKEGDMILGADGKPTKVTFVTPVQINHQCYKVTFEDGEEVIADADHNWFVRDKSNKCLIRTTQELLHHYKHKRKDGKGTEYLYRVPMNKAVELPEAKLPIDPYTLGLWLGDGTTNKPCFTVHKDDLDMYDALIPMFGQYKTHPYCKNPNTLEVAFTGDKGKDNSVLRHKLKDAEVLAYKHIPSIYLRASKEQRLALLQGLMDTMVLQEQTDSANLFRRMQMQQMDYVSYQLLWESNILEGKRYLFAMVRNVMQYKEYNSLQTKHYPALDLKGSMIGLKTHLINGCCGKAL